jgi:hypothetical protein
VDGQADRPALLGQRARHGLADPPGRVGGELEAHRVVELLDRADQAEVALLDQVEEWHAGLRVVARDRHHKPEVRLDQLALRCLVALVLAARELALLGRREQPAVADLAHVELERILRRLGDRNDLFLLVVGLLPGLRLRLRDGLGSGLVLERLEAGQQFEAWLGGVGNGLEDGLCGVGLHLGSVSAFCAQALRNPLKPVENNLR